MKVWGLTGRLCFATVSEPDCFLWLHCVEYRLWGCIVLVSHSREALLSSQGSWLGSGRLARGLFLHSGLQAWWSTGQKCEGVYGSLILGEGGNIYHSRPRICAIKGRNGDIKA
jgi:hypothetical protein